MKHCLYPCLTEYSARSLAPKGPYLLDAFLRWVSCIARSPILDVGKLHRRTMFALATAGLLCAPALWASAGAGNVWQDLGGDGDGAVLPNESFGLNTLWRSRGAVSLNLSLVDDQLAMITRGAAGLDSGEPRGGDLASLVLPRWPLTPRSICRRPTRVDERRRTRHAPANERKYPE